MEIKRFIVGQLATNCYLLLGRSELAIIDPGGGLEKLVAAVKETNKRLKYIINTHYHGDHTARAGGLKKNCGGEILIHEAEKNFLQFDADKYIRDGDKIKINQTILSAIHTPGHTTGSICLLGDKVIFTGDTLFRDGRGRTDLPSGSESAMQESLAKLARIIKPGMTVYPGHGEIFEAQ